MPGATKVTTQPPLPYTSSRLHGLCLRLKYYEPLRGGSFPVSRPQPREPQPSPGPGPESPAASRSPLQPILPPRPLESQQPTPTERRGGARGLTCTRRGAGRGLTWITQTRARAHLGSAGRAAAPGFASRPRCRGRSGGGSALLQPLPAGSPGRCSQLVRVPRKETAAGNRYTLFRGVLAFSGIPSKPVPCVH